MTRTSRVPPMPCPHCGKTLNAATPTRGTGAPGPGDFTICVGCLAVLKFTAGLRVRPVDAEEWEAEPADVREAVARAAGTIAAATGRLKRKQ